MPGVRDSRLRTGDSRIRIDVLAQDKAQLVAFGPRLFNPHLLVEVLRCDVSAIGPHKRAKLGMNQGMPEVLQVMQRFEE